MCVCTAQVRAGHEEDVTQHFVNEAGKAFQENALLGLVQATQGQRYQKYGTGQVQLVELVDFSRPIMLRRKMFLEVSAETAAAS